MISHDIIWLHQRLYDKWSKKYKSENISINKDKSMVTVKTRLGVTMYGREVVKKGVFEWRVKIISFNGKGDWLPYIGIVENDKGRLWQYLDNVNFDNFGYCLCGGSDANGAVWSFEGQVNTKANFVWEEDGDILDMKLDLTTNKLHFKKSDSNDEVCIDVKISPKGYRFALSLCDDSQFQFIS